MKILIFTIVLPCLLSSCSTIFPEAVMAVEAVETQVATQIRVDREAINNVIPPSVK